MLYANFGCLERCCNNPAMQCHSTTRCQQHHMLQQSQLAVKLGNQSVRSVHRIVRPADRRHRLVSALPAADTAATVLPATYAALGLAGVGFVGTFFIAPKFKESFKEDVDWRDIYSELKSAGVKQVDAMEAYAKGRRKKLLMVCSGGAVLVDVRLVNKYEAGHAAGSFSIPLYNPIQSWDLPSIIRRAGFAFFGIYGTELNTQFASDVQRRIPRGKQVIVICENGGTLENKSGTKYGFQSRSLKAVYYLQKAGFKNVAYVKGGISQWARDKLPLAEGSPDPAAAFDNNKDDDDDNEGGFNIGGLRLPQLTSVFSR